MKWEDEQPISLREGALRLAAWLLMAILIAAGLFFAFSYPTRTFVIGLLESLRTLLISINLPPEIAAITLILLFDLAFPASFFLTLRIVRKDNGEVELLYTRWTLWIIFAMPASYITREIRRNMGHLETSISTGLVIAGYLILLAWVFIITSKRKPKEKQQQSIIVDK